MNGRSQRQRECGEHGGRPPPAPVLFYDVEEMPWGFRPADGAYFALLHVAGAGTPRAAPPGATTFKERVLGARTMRTLPEQLPGPGLPRRVEEAFAEYVESLAPAGPNHRAGGLAAWIQDDGRLEAAIAAAGGSAGTPDDIAQARRKLAPGDPAAWRLLWQLDSDDDAGFMWGDLGRLYLLVRDADLRAGRLDRAWLVLQCG